VRYTSPPNSQDLSHIVLKGDNILYLKERVRQAEGRKERKEDEEKKES
jgi:hypothetical protein